MGELDTANKKACGTFSVPILKFCCVVLGYLVVQVGWHAHFESKFNQDMFHTETGVPNHNTGKSFCWDETPSVAGINCPFNVVHLEGIFIFNTVLYLLFSVGSLVTGFVCKIPGSKLQYHDKSIHMCAGLELIGAAALILAAVAQIDIYRNKHLCSEPPFGDTVTKNNVTTVKCNEFGNNTRLKASFDDAMEYQRHQEKFLDKIVAGALCFFLGILYLFTWRAVAKEGCPGGQVAPAQGACDPNSPSCNMDVEAGKGSPPVLAPGTNKDAVATKAGETPPVPAPMANKDAAATEAGKNPPDTTPKSPTKGGSLAKL